LIQIQIQIQISIRQLRSQDGSTAKRTIGQRFIDIR